MTEPHCTACWYDTKLRGARVVALPRHSDNAALAGCELVIEAVFEEPNVMAESTRRADQQ